jgi:hypothetical protein
MVQASQLWTVTPDFDLVKVARLFGDDKGFV